MRAFFFHSGIARLALHNKYKEAPPCPPNLTPKQDDSNRELQICITEALYDVDSIVADPGAYTKEQLAALHSQILSNLERAWAIAGGSEDQLTGTMMQISQAVTCPMSSL